MSNENYIPDIIYRTDDFGEHGISNVEDESITERDIMYLRATPERLAAAELLAKLTAPVSDEEAAEAIKIRHITGGTIHDSSKASLENFLKNRGVT